MSYEKTGFIFAEEVALKDRLGGMVVHDYNADQAGVARAVPVKFNIPDVELTQMTYPSVIIALLDIRPANDRQISGYWIDDDYQGTIDPVTGTNYRYYQPVAYDLVFQVTTWARHPFHDRMLIQQMLQRFPSKYGTLRVPSENGEAIANRSMFLDEFVKLDYVEDNRRTYKNSYTIRIVSEFTQPQAAAILSNFVQSVGINVTTSDIPSNYEPI